jgi:hypothetical protein
MPKAKKPTPTQTSTRPKRTTTTKQAASVSVPSVKQQRKPSRKIDAELSEAPGVGFKDSTTAKSTISSIGNRSLTYQYQTISTMYNRATHHPHKTPGIDAAIAVFKEWIDVTYPAAKEKLRGDGGFKPLLSKDVVSKYLPSIRKKLSKDDARFAEFYVGLEKGKRLGNILIDEATEDGGDWESERYMALDNLVPEGKEGKSDWADEELWDGKEATVEHLRLVSWAWSPVPGRTLASK